MPKDHSAMSELSISGRAAIVGLGATEFSKNSGRTEVRLAMEATLQALNDAGIDPAEVDGFSSYSVDKVPEYEIARLLGAKNVRFFSQVPHGGGAACGPVLHAAMAVATGIARTVVVYRAMNERSWYRFGNGNYGFGSSPLFENVNYGWYMPYGFHTPAAWVGMFARRYMHTYGATSEDFGRVAVAFVHAQNLETLGRQSTSLVETNQLDLKRIKGQIVNNSHKHGSKGRESMLEGKVPCPPWRCVRATCKTHRCARATGWRH
jgi:hypothetical protein